MPGALSYPIEKVRGQRHYKIVNFQISDISRRSCGILPWGYRRYCHGGIGDIPKGLGRYRHAPWSPYLRPLKAAPSTLGA